MSTQPSEKDIHQFYPEDYEPYQPVKKELPARSASTDESLSKTVEKARLQLLFDRLNAWINQRYPDTLQEDIRNFYLPKMESALLDFGCGSHKFLSKARDKGWKATIGIDFSKRTIKLIRNKGHIGHLYSPEVWNEIENNSIEVVRMNHVLEHLYEPDRVLKHLREKLQSGGRIHIAVPNPAGVSSSLYRSFWRGLECPRHVMLYPPRLLKRLLKKAGFQQIRILHETISKDFVRSWGFFLEDLRMIKHEDVEELIYNEDLAQLLYTPMRLMALWGRADRIHVFAEKV